MFTSGEKSYLAGIGFGVYMLLTPCVFVVTWLLASLRSAVLLASWFAVVGILLMMLGYALNWELAKNFYTLVMLAILPAMGYIYFHYHGYTWLWALGWSLFALGLVTNLRRLVAVRRPSALSYEVARRIMARYYDVPPVVRFMMSAFHWLTTISLGIFLVAAALGYRGYLATAAPLAVATAMIVLNGILTFRYRRELTQTS